MSIHPALQPRRVRHQWRRLPAVLLLAALLALAVSLPAAAQIQPQQEDALAAISPHLESELAAAGEPVSFLVVLGEQVDAQAALEAADFAAAEPLDRTARATALYRTLTRRALASQAPLRAWLDARGIDYRPFYIVNMIEVRGDAATAQALRSFAEVDRLVANPLVASQEAGDFQKAASFLTSRDFLQDQEAGPATHTETDALPYGLVYARAPEVWEMGFRGQGIVVASQDTGVQWDHPASRQATAAGTQRRTSPTMSTTGTTPGSQQLYKRSADPVRRQRSRHAHRRHDDRRRRRRQLRDHRHGARSAVDRLPQHVGRVGHARQLRRLLRVHARPYPQDGDPFTDGKPERAPHIINNSWGCPRRRL